MYDFGSASENEQHYHQATPPKYDVTKLPIKTAVYYGGKDPLADPQDVDYWTAKLSSDVLVFKRLIPDWGHGDFVWTSSELGRQVYDQIVELMNKHK